MKQDAHKEDMAVIGERLMQTIKDNREGLRGWAPIQCPSEIVADLLNERDELEKSFEPYSWQIRNVGHQFWWHISEEESKQYLQLPEFYEVQILYRKVTP